MFLRFEYNKFWIQNIFDNKMGHQSNRVMKETRQVYFNELNSLSLKPHTSTSQTVLFFSCKKQTRHQTKMRNKLKCLFSKFTHKLYVLFPLSSIISQECKRMRLILGIFAAAKKSMKKSFWGFIIHMTGYIFFFFRI